MSPVSLALSMSENQSASVCARRHISKKALRPFGVPMNTAQPSRSAEARADDLRPHPRIHIGVFVEHDAVEVDAAQRVGVVGAVEPHLPAISIVDAQLALMQLAPVVRTGRHGAAQIVPRHRLRLLEKGRNIGKARALSSEIALRRAASRGCRRPSCRRGGA